MHHYNGSNLNRNCCESGEPSINAKDEREPADDLKEDHEVGERAREPQALKELGETRGREYEDFQAAVNEKIDTERHSEDKSGVRSKFRVDHAMNPLRWEQQVSFSA